MGHLELKKPATSGGGTTAKVVSTAGGPNTVLIDGGATFPNDT